MTSIRRQALALCLAFLSLPLCSNAQTTTTYQIGDDGHTNVPIPFSFPYYGQTFTDSWMYDNGIVSFVQPGTAGSISPWQWSAPYSLSQSGASYFIAPLWADIAPTAGTTYSTTADGTSLRYDWKNISEFYSGGTRLSSFSTTINSSGEISNNYYSLNLNTSNILSGAVGDISKGEYYQAYQANYGTQVNDGTIPNWTLTTYGTVASDPCLTDPMSSTTCPGYMDALAKLTNISTPTATVDAQSATSTADPVSTTDNTALVASTPATTTATTIEPAVSVDTPTATASPTVTTTTVTAAPTATVATAPSSQPVKAGEVAQSQSTTKSSGVSTSQILGIISKEQSRLSTLESSTVSATTQQANQAASSATQQAESVAAAAQSQSIQTSVQAGQQAAVAGAGSAFNDGNGASFSVNAQSVVTSAIANSALTGQTPTATQLGISSGATGISLDSSNAITLGNNGAENSSATTLVATAPGTQQTSNQTPAALTLIQTAVLANDTDKVQVFSTTDITYNKIMEGQNTTLVYFNPDVQEKKISEVKRNVRDNDAAGDVKIDSIAVVPIGFNVYSIALADATFYTPKEIYKNQKNVDNVRLLRGLTGGSDRLHQQMVDEQYK